MLNKKIVLIGGGNMGHSLLRGILKAGLTPPENFTVVDIHEGKLASMKEEFGVHTATEAAGVIPGAEVVILAVKPYTLNDVIDGFSAAASSEQLFISIVAGVRGGYISSRIGKDNPVVRCMPNIAATVDAAASAICACSSATAEHMEIAETILGAVGEVVQVEEHHMDAVTGLSGSGPAYIYMVIEALCDGGVKMGLPRDVAMKLATQTVVGASRLVKESGEHPATLRDRVTTPGGTTIAAVHELEERGLRAMLISAVVTATEQSKALDRETRGEDSSKG